MSARTVDEETIRRWISENSSLGGSSYLFKTEKILTNTEILALPTTPIEIIPSQGSGKGIIVVSALAKLDSSGGAYNNSSNATLILQGSPLPFNVKQLKFIGTGLDDSAGIYYSYTSPFNSSNYALPDQIDNAGISIASQNTGDYEDGNAANTLKVTVYYIVVDL